MTAGTGKPKRQGLTREINGRLVYSHRGVTRGKTTLGLAKGPSAIQVATVHLTLRALPRERGWVSILTDLCSV